MSDETEEAETGIEHRADQLDRETPIDLRSADIICNLTRANAELGVMVVEMLDGKRHEDEEYDEFVDKLVSRPTATATTDSEGSGR